MISEQVHAIIKIHAIAVHKHLSVASSLIHKSVKKRYLDIYFLGSCRGDALKKKKGISGLWVIFTWPRFLEEVGATVDTQKNLLDADEGRATDWGSMSACVFKASHVVILPIYFSNIKLNTTYRKGVIVQRVLDELEAWIRWITSIGICVLLFFLHLESCGATEVPVDGMVKSGINLDLILSI